MKKVFLVAYGGGHINIVNLIAQKLLSDTNIEFKILALMGAYNSIIDQYPLGTVKKISDYKSLFETKSSKIISIGSKLLGDTYTNAINIAKDDLIFYLGISMLNLIEEYGEEIANALYKEKGRQAFLPIKIMEQILKYEKTEVVISTTSPRFEQASLLAGNNLNIETIEILDLFGELYPLPEAKHIVCMNKSVEYSLRKQGLVDRKYYCFGQPAIENTANKVMSLDVDLIKKKLDISSGITILYATQKPCSYNSDFSYCDFVGYETINTAIFNIFDKLNRKYDINILLRIHPNESIDNYADFLKDYPFVKYVNDTIGLEESLSVCDILLTPASTVGVEAIASCKAVFTFRYHLDKTFPLPTLKEKPFIFSDGFIELEDNLINFLSGSDFKNRSQNIKNNFLPKDSLINIIKLIKEL